MELLLYLSTLSQWNSPCCSDQTTGKNPYLSYTITVESSKLNIPKLSEYQVSLYQKICDLRFDENLTRKRVTEKLNKLGYTSTRGGENTLSTVCSTYFKISKHFERQNIYHLPDLDDVKLIWKWTNFITSRITLGLIEPILFF